MDIIERTAPNAQFRNETQHSVDACLNTFSCQGFGDMFSTLEAKSTELGIKSLRINVTTVKDMYLR